MKVVEKKMGGNTPEFECQNSKKCLEALFVFHSTVIHQERSPVEAWQSPFSLLLNACSLFASIALATSEGFGLSPQFTFVA